MGPKALTFIHSVARKSLTKGQGSGITKIPSAMQAEAKASEIFTNLVEAGLKPEMMDDFIRSEADVAKYLNILESLKQEQIKARARIRDRAAEKAIKEGIAIPADSPRGKEITEQLFGKRGTVVDMKGNVIPEGSGIMGGESIESLMKSGDVTKGTVTKKSKKVTDRDMFRAANQRLSKPKTDVNTIIKNINSMEPIDAMKEANKVIKREGPYKNLNQQQAKKILEDTEDHIFQRNVTPKETDVPMEETADEVTKAYIDAVRKGKFKGTEDQFRDMIDKMMDEDFASGGRVGLRYGGDTMGGKNDKSKSSPGPDRSHVSDRQERSHQRAVAEAQMVNKINEAQAKESPIKTFFDHANFTKGLKRVGSIPNYHQLGGYDFMSRFSNVPPMIAKGLGYGYQGLTEFGKSLTNSNYSLREAYDRAKEEGRLNALGVDAYGDPTNPITQQYANLPMELQPNFESGGRVGLAGGMTRRAFLKLMGGAAATIGAAKSGIISAGKKGATKKVVKEVIKTPPVNGKPEWFDALVNKVILEGDDVTKKLATKDREIVHTKKINDQESVTVTQDLDDGAIRVEYDSPDNMGQEPVMMQFKPGRADETTGGKKPADRFDVVETEPRYTGGPEDGDIEFIGESGGPDISFLESDVTNLKTFATGKGPTMKEIVKSKKRKDLVRKVNDDNYEAAEFIGGKYGDGPEPDFPDDYSGYASGGLAYLLGE